MTQTFATPPQRFLVLSGTVPKAGGVIPTLQSQYDVKIVHTIEQALEALRSGVFDAVVSETDDFLPLERAAAQQQGGMILDTISEGICIVSPDGKILWANRRAREWQPEARERISAGCLQAYKAFTTGIPEPGKGRGNLFSFDVGNGEQFFDLQCSPVINAERTVTQIVAICYDVTPRRRLQQRIDAIDHAGQELMRLEGESIAKLQVGQRLKLLEEKVIGFSRQLLNFDHFAIRLLDPRTNKLELIMSLGMPTEALEVELFAKEEGNGISGFVASTGESYICEDVLRDPKYVKGLTNARSSLTVPLKLHGKVRGVFNIESQTPGNFSKDDKQFAEIFGRYVAIALNILDLLVVERHATTTVLAQDVSSEISGPLNDIVSEATVLMEDYIGDENMRKRLAGIVENVGKIRKSIKDVVEGSKGLKGVGTAEKTKDPLLVGKRILVADDEPNIRQTIVDLLMRQGCIVESAKDGAEAMALLAGQAPYDLVLSDIKMPHKNGYEIFAAAKKLGHSPPVILMTGFGYDPAHSIVRASQEGLAAVLFKPFKVDQLMGEIRKAVSASK